MSKLYASIRSDARKTEATSRGHRSISTHTRGWTLGVRVEARLDGLDAETFDLYVTSGSTGGPGDEYIGNVALHDGHRYFFPAYAKPEHDDADGVTLAAEPVTIVRNDYPNAPVRGDRFGWVVAAKTGGHMTEPYRDKEHAETVRARYAPEAHLVLVNLEWDGEAS